MHVLMVGDPFDGMRIIGPIDPNDPNLEDYIAANCKDVTWWYVPVTSLQDARLEVE